LKQSRKIFEEIVANNNSVSCILDESLGDFVALGVDLRFKDTKERPFFYSLLFNGQLN
jgi:hypothetical protein